MAQITEYEDLDQPAGWGTPNEDWDFTPEMANYIEKLKLFEKTGIPYVLKDGDEILLGNRASEETWRDGDVFDVPMWYLHGRAKGLYE